MFDKMFFRGVAIGVASIASYEAIKWGIGKARERMLLMPQDTQSPPPRPNRLRSSTGVTYPPVVSWAPERQRWNDRD